MLYDCYIFTSQFVMVNQLQLVPSSLITEPAKMLIRAFISDLLDSCNVSVVVNNRRFDHITPVLCKLHLLSIRHRTRFKLVMTLYRCLNGSAYVDDNCVPVSSVATTWHLRPADTQKLVLCSLRAVLSAVV